MWVAVIGLGSALVALLGAGAAMFMWMSVRSKLQASEAELTRFQGVRDIEAHQQRVQAEIASLSAQQQEQTSAMQTKVAELRTEAAQGETYLTQLRHEVAIVEDVGLAQSFGFYEPRYGLESSERLTARLKQNRDEQKRLVKSNLATVAPDNWTVDGSIAKGRKMVKEQIKLMLRAFNGECDGAISKVKYNNALNLAERINRSFAAINKLGTSQRIEITSRYLTTKLSELHLVHEHRERKQEEKVEQQRIKEQMRDEQKAQKQLDKIQADAEKAESKEAAALATARAQLAEATGKQTSKLELLVAKLETGLSEAIDRKAKAVARAQLTRSGHVYLLSNVGSFGEGVYKIGMTRRLEPLDRVRELGDASVPFRFDVHAMIYAEDAPALETKLHREFADRRVNRVNLRREYFRVSIDEVRKAVAKHHGIVTFVLEPEAEEYRKTMAMGQSQEALSA